ncbi:HD domain-containing phosphohydrolase [Pseudomonas sp. EA_65y_Pfl1_P113]|uniref:HD-GYP domain-containing protein n=1 Tax=Pseudomonas sp. EA_65y_Pfl1_P113 TaxID=3088692 RepID=UPI0030D98DF9
MFSKVYSEKNIVIINKAPTRLLRLSSYLRAFGLRNIITISNVREDLDWLRLNSWDLLILNLEKTALIGFDIFEVLKECNRAEVPFLILTDFNDIENMHSFFEKAPNDFTSKHLKIPESAIKEGRTYLELVWLVKKLREANGELIRSVKSRTAQLELSYKASINSLCRAASYRDTDTGCHIYRIGDSAALLARAIGMPSHWCEMIRIAAPMHDVGKIGIEDAILQKNGPLTAAERKIMREHPRIGYEILYDTKGSPLSDLSAEIALRHHERWDGTGYPDGLRCEEIPLSARIVAICDVYDALRMSRPYKQAWDLERSRNYIIEQAGKHFDSSLVDAFCNLIYEIEKLSV